MGDFDAPVLGRVSGTDGAVAACTFDAALLRAERRASDDGAHNRSIGGIVRIDASGTPVFATVVSLHGDPGDSARIAAECEYIGEGIVGPAGALAGFHRGVTAFPQPGDPLRFATEGELEAIFAPPDMPHIELGTVFPTAGVRAPVLFDQLIGRHFDIFG